MSVIGFVIADTEKALARLGGKMVIEHTLEQLHAARGIDRVVCYSNLPSRKLQTLCTVCAITQEFAANPIEVIKANYDATRAIITVATAVMITSATYEKCLRKISATVPCVVPGRRQPAIHGKELKAERVFVPVETVTAFDPHAPYPNKNYGTVDIDILQTLDVEDPFQFQIVEALIAAEKKCQKNLAASVPRKYLGGVALPVHSAISKPKRMPKKS